MQCTSSCLLWANSGRVSATLNAKATTQISVYAEHLDLSRSSGPRHDDVVRTFLRDKYSERLVGLIVAQGSVALDFLMRTCLWPNTPVVIARGLLKKENVIELQEFDFNEVASLRLGFHSRRL
jgi:hypothetical protein